jgi:hypothetical protein
MKKITLLAFSAAIAVNACAQQNRTAMKYAKLITAGHAKKHLSILASDAYEGRETGKPGAEKAANYIAAEFKRLGLKAPNGSYFFNVPLVQKVLKMSAFTVNGKSFVLGTDFFPNGSVVDNDIKGSDIVFVGYGTESEIGTTDLAGKIVLWINEDKPEAGKAANTAPRMSTARQAIVKNLQSKNPAAIVAANGELTAMLKRYGRNVTSPRLVIKEDAKPGKPPVPVFMVVPAIADELLKSTGKTYADLKTDVAANPIAAAKADFVATYNNEQTDVKAVDVVGFMPGTDLKNEVLVFSAHYDHIGLETQSKQRCR